MAEMTAHASEPTVGNTAWGLIIIMGVILLLAAAILLQLWITRNGSLYGLILPVVFVGIATTAILVMAANEVFPEKTALLAGLMTWILMNIPSLVLLVIWLARRKRSRRVQDIDRLDIQDL